MAEPQQTQAGGETEPQDPQEALYLDLHAERTGLEEKLKLLQQQQQFGGSPSDIEHARAQEETALRDLDRVLTLIRAAEIRRRPGVRRWD